MAAEEDFDVPPIVEAMIEAVKKLGPHVMEVRNCHKCGLEFWVYHPFCETIGCGYCRHPHGSIVKKYLSVRENLVDTQ
jgi:hypothetical protein